MLFTPTARGVGGGCGVAFILQLLAALQMLMTLDMPLSTTLALPVTSKPIESTAENLAWQAWIMLPPEQKQLMKSRKVTPKSIFTLPLRVECPEGHQQVDTKCIPTVIGSNAVLIDPNVLGLVLGNAPIDIEYDYEDEGGEDKLPYPVPSPYNPPLFLNGPMEGVKSNDDAVLELKPPTQDAPLKFNIFQSKFPTDGYPLEDYSSVSNEGVQLQENETNNNQSLSINKTLDTGLNVSLNATTDKDLLSEASNVSKVHTFTTLPDTASDFNLDDIDAISVPASGNGVAKPHKISLFREDSSLHLVTSTIDTNAAVTGEKDNAAPLQTEHDLETLLQTESFMPIFSQSATTPQSISLTTALKDERVSSSSDASAEPTFSFNVNDEEMTTMPNIIEKELDTMATEDKAEYIRSVTINYLSTLGDEGNSDEITTLTPSTNDDEPSEETTTSPTIQLDDTTVIEGNDESPTSSSLSSLLMSSTPSPPSPPLVGATDSSTTSTSSLSPSSSPSPLAVEPSSTSVATTLQSPGVELTTLLMQQEQALKDFEELQRMRKGQKDQQHTVVKKSKVEPVEVLATTANTAAATTEATTPSETTQSLDELITATATETVTPLLRVHNNDNSNDNNDRFYYQHFAKQDLESGVVASSASTTQQQPSSSPTTTRAAADTEALASTATSEIDLAQELRLINELVKGKRPSAMTTTTTTTADASSTTSAKTSEESLKSTTPKTTTDELVTWTAASSSSESSVSSTKPTRATTEIWSKIMPLIKTTVKPTITTVTTTTTTLGTTQPSTTTSEISEASSTGREDPSPTVAVVSNRSHRNSKIIRINGFNTIHATPPNEVSATTTTIEGISNDPSIIAATKTTTTMTTIATTIADDNVSPSSSSSLPSDGSYEPFWWLPVAWRFEKPTTPMPTTTNKPEQEHGNESKEMPLLLRFWSAYHAPRSS